MLVPRPLDHLVLAQNSLADSTATFVDMGFVVAPKAVHPFGTANTVIQFANRAYLELLAIEAPEAIPDEPLSFGAVARDFLVDGEGISMVALNTQDAVADRASFEKAGLTVGQALRFERLATGPDGIDRPLAFSVVVTGDERLKRAGFMVCQHHTPENFWFDDYQRHPNGARRLDTVVMVAADPADYHEFLTYFTGQHDIRSTSLGIELRMGETGFEVLSPPAFAAFFGEDGDEMINRVAGFTVEVDNLAATREYFDERAVPYQMRTESLIIASTHAHGAAIAFFEA
ncbi:MAG: VOC family protein [Alphaproteobacteria bacterium]